MSRNELISREEYIERLTRALRNVPSQDAIDIIAYVEEYFDEAGEREAQMALGSPETCARQMAADLAASIPPIPPVPPQNGKSGQSSWSEQMSEWRNNIKEDNSYEQKNSREEERSSYNHKQASTKDSSRKVWTILLGILSLPISIPLALAVVVILFALALVVFCLWLALIIVVLCCGLGMVLLVWRFVQIVFTDLAGAAYVLGMAMLCAGLGTLAIEGLGWMKNKGMPAISRWLGGIYGKLKGKVSRHA